MILPWNIGQLSPTEWKFRMKTALLLFASLGTGIFLGAVGCLHYDINSMIQNRALFSSYGGDACPTPKAIPTKQEGEASEPPKAKQISLQHGMSDEELLWQASLIHRRKAVPPHRRKLPKVAFMFLTRGPLPLAPLWEYFFASYHEFYSIYVHADPSYTPNTSPSSVFHRRNIPSQVCSLTLIQITCPNFPLNSMLPAVTLDIYHAIVMAKGVGCGFRNSYMIF